MSCTRIGVIQHSKYTCHMWARRRHIHNAFPCVTLSVT